MHVATMGDQHDCDQAARIVDAVDDAVLAVPEPILLRPLSFSLPNGRGSLESAWIRATTRRLILSGSPSICFSADRLITSL